MYSTLRTVTACLYTERERSRSLSSRPGHFSYPPNRSGFLLFLLFPPFLLSSGWPWPRLDYIDRDSRRWKRRARCVSSTPIIWCPLAVSPIASVNAPLFFFFSLFSSVSRWYGRCFFTHNSRQFQSLEKILVQNIRVGLSPSFTEAIRSISRWKFVQSSLPHVMLCTAQLINERYKLDLLFNFFFSFLPSIYWNYVFFSSSF